MIVHQQSEFIPVSVLYHVATVFLTQYCQIGRSSKANLALLSPSRSLMSEPHMHIYALH